MNTSPKSTVWDSIIIGGGPAGLAAALALGRSLRRVLVIDAGQPRNRRASHMHTVLGNEGISPTELLRRGQEEAAAYGVSFLEGSVSTVEETEPEGGRRTMVVTPGSGHQLYARTVVAAAGIADRLPEIPGLAERWGSSVLHCPYCHGWEVRHRRLGVLASGPMALHQAELIRQWSEELTFFSAAAEPLEADSRRRLESRGIVVEPAEVTALHGEGSALSDVQLEDGRRVPVDAIFTAGDPVPHEDFLEGLNLYRSETPLGSVIAVDQGGRTSHERVWAAGNLVAPMGNIPMSISAGTMAGAMVNSTLIAEEFDLATARSRV